MSSVAVRKGPGLRWAVSFQGGPCLSVGAADQLTMASRFTVLCRHRSYLYDRCAYDFIVYESTTFLILAIFYFAHKSAADHFLNWKIFPKSMSNRIVDRNNHGLDCHGPTWQEVSLILCVSRMNSVAVWCGALTQTARWRNTARNIVIIAFWLSLVWLKTAVAASFLVGWQFVV